MQNKEDASKTVTFTIDGIPSDVWKKFKDAIPRSTTLNNALIQLIREKAEDKK